jgi:trans-aconitate methyltransferase
LATVAQAYNAPAAAILDKIVLRTTSPRIAHGAGEVGSLLRDRFPKAELVAFDGNPGGSSDAAYDLIVSVADGARHQSPEATLDYWARLLERVGPDGVLAVQHAAPDDDLERMAAEAARNLGLERCGAPALKPELAFERLVGPLCAGLEIWSSRVWLQLTAQETLFTYSERGAVGAFLSSLGGETTEAGAAFKAECMRLHRLRFPHTFRDGTTLCSVSRVSALATRPSLMDIYSEYSSYHDHQLTKGWKS